jgi:exonuclease VII small subunit
VPPALPAPARTKEQAEINLRQALRDSEKAADGVSEAENKLHELRKVGEKGTREAERDVADAKDRVREATFKVEDAQAALNDVNNIGKDGTKAVTDAQDALTQAQLRVRDATEAVADAQKAAQGSGQAHEDKTKEITAAYEAQKKAIFDTIQTMVDQGKSQQEIDAFIDASGKKLDEYANKYKLAKGDVDDFKDSLEKLAIMSDDARLGAATAGAYVPPAWTQGPGVMSANSAEQRITTRVVVPLMFDKKTLAEAIIDIDRGYN